MPQRRVRDVPPLIPRGSGEPTRCPSRLDGWDGPSHSHFCGRGGRRAASPEGAFGPAGQAEPSGDAADASRSAVGGEKKLDTPRNPFKMTFAVVTAFDGMSRLAAWAFGCRRAGARLLAEGGAA